MICLFDEEFAGEVEKRNSTQNRENIFSFCVSCCYIGLNILMMLIDDFIILKKFLAIFLLKNKLIFASS